LRHPTLLLLTSIPAITALGKTKEGSCRLIQANAFDKGVVTVQVGQKIKGTCKFYIQEFFGTKIINANVEIVNTSDQAMHCHYYVAFFDTAGNRHLTARFTDDKTAELSEASRGDGWILAKYYL
jgi:hypothetical protein